MNRRALLQATIGVAGAAPLANAQVAPPGARLTTRSVPHPITSSTVVLFNDGAPVSPEEQVQRLAHLTAGAVDPTDQYLKGGAVAELEAQAAKMFGKPAAAFFPTGTMANNVAVRILCGDKRLVITQRDSHLYADESNAPAILSGLNVVPLAPGRVSPTPDEIRNEVERWETGFFSEKVGAISLESPVRAHDGAYIPYADVAEISAFARERKIGMHWDGARSLLLYGTPGFNLPAISAAFDTIMLSLDKYLDAPTGALLLGDGDLIDQARHVRHIFGGLMDKGWQLALPPLAALPGFEARYLEASQRATAIVGALHHAPGFDVRPVRNGTNITPIKIAPAYLNGLRDRLARNDLRARISEDGLMTFYANATLLRRPTSDIVRALTDRSPS